MKNSLAHLFIYIRLLCYPESGRAVDNICMTLFDIFINELLSGPWLRNTASNSSFFLTLLNTYHNLIEPCAGSFLVILLGGNIVMTQFPYRMSRMDSRPKMDLRKKKLGPKLRMDSLFRKFNFKNSWSTFIFFKYILLHFTERKGEG